MPESAPVLARLLVAIVLVLVCASPVWGEVPLERQTKEQLERTKLRGEISKLSDESGPGADLARLAPAFTALVAVIGVFLTLWKQIAESSRQRTLDREQRERERTQRFDEQFGKMIENLGSPTNATRAAAAVQIATFLRPEYTKFHEQVFALLLATLRFPRNDVGDRILARAFQEVAPAQIEALRKAEPDVQLDLSRCYLARIDISGLDLSNADIAFADLHGATLRSCHMFRVRGFQVNLNGAKLTDAALQEARLAEASLKAAQFHDARLVSANLKGVDATGASFQRAKLQEAHFEGAVLRGTHFEGTNLNNAYFAGAQLDEVARNSIARGADNWRKANFDSAVKADLERRSDEAAK